MALTWGQRFLMMQRGGSRILGGGSVVWSGATDRKIRNRLSFVFEDPEKQPVDHLHLKIQVQGAARCHRDQSADLAQEAGLAVLGTWVFDAANLASLKSEILARVGGTAPVSAGDLTGEIGLDSDPLQAVLDDMIRRGEIVAKGPVLQLAGASPQADLSRLAKRLLKDLADAGGAGLERGRLDTPGALRELRTLAHLGLAVSLNGDIFYAKETYDTLVQRIVAGRKTGSSFSIGEARERTGLSRKYLIPLLNRMESAGIVRREGDVRIVQ
jgi:selenocysteine-specific elongation factor